MNRLALLLGKTEAEVHRLVSELEHKTGYQSTDVRFLAAHQLAVRAKVGELGLDPDDTTGEELYRALQARFGRDSRLFDKTLGLSDGASAADITAAVRQFIKLHVDKIEVWALKPAAIKNLLRANVPKKTLKQFGYRSVESLLKREDIGVVALAVTQTESPAWQRKFSRAAAKTAASNYEMRHVKLVEVELPRQQLAACDPLSGTLALSSQLSSEHISSLSICFAAFDELAQLNGRPAGEHPLLSSPVLAWWKRAAHLASLHDGVAVSFNIRDVAHNYARKLDWRLQSSTHAAQAIYNELTGAYNQQAETVPDEVYDDEPIKQLAADAVEV